MQIIDERRSRPLVQALRRRRSLRAGLVQLLYIVVGVALGLVVPAIDIGPRIPSGEMVALMAGITAGLLALTSVVFALLFLVVQFAATAQSPRLHLFRDNPLVWHALGLIVGVMVYATASAVVAGGQDTTSVLVPTSVVFVVLVAVALTRRLQLDALQSMQLSPALDQITTRTRQVIDRLYTAPFPQPPLPQLAPPDHPVQVRWPATQAVLRQVDMPQLVDLARQSGAIIRLLVMPGDLVRERAVVMEVWNPTTAPATDPLLKCLEVGIERSFTQDPLFGFRLLNDIALRSMSLAINDPASTVQAIDCIENLLATLADRDLAVGLIIDDAGRPRVIFDAPGWDEFLAAGADEIAETAMQPMVRRRLHAMLEHLRDIAPPERRQAVEHRLAQLDRAAR